jgi:ribosomal protein S18 acetylase RimI-like enzyme
MASGFRPLPPIRRLTAEDAAAFHRLRLEGFERHPLQFRVAIEDEAGLTLDAVATRLTREYVVGGFVGSELVGIGGLSQLTGAKLNHKALLWGMYVRQDARGAGMGDAIVAALLDRAVAEGFRTVVLTVAADNNRARRLYERWGFETYGIEPGSVREGDGYFDEALMSWQSPTGGSSHE